jgi:hypothetical protein
MKKIASFLLITSIATFVFYSCNKKQATTEESTSLADTQVAPDSIVRKSAVSVDSLTSILLTSLKTKDKNLYVSYCFTSQQEEALANMIIDKKKKKYFLREFGFSLHEEVYYFENIVKYIAKTGIDLTKIEPSIIEVFDYNKSNYTEITLKEVVIPIIQDDFERDIVYVAIQVDGKWYFTSELSL